MYKIEKIKNGMERFNLKGNVSEVFCKREYLGILDNNLYFDVEPSVDINYNLALRDFNKCVDSFNEFEYDYLKYDSNGRIKLLYFMHENFNYLYDEAGRLTECVIYFKGDEFPHKRIFYEYNVNDLIIKQTIYNYKIGIDDFDSDVGIRFEYKKEGILSETVELFYDRDNRLVQIEKYCNKEHSITIKNKFDTSGNIIEQKKRNKKGAFDYYHIFCNYNEKNLMVKKEWKIRSSIGITNEKTSMNNYGNFYLKDETSWYSNEKQSVFLADYNESSDIIQIKMSEVGFSSGVEFSNESIVITYNYIYDEFNNWISRTGKVNGNAVVIETREVKYLQNS